MQSYVAGFMFTEDQGHVVLVEKQRPAWQAGKLNAVGGKIEVGETPIEAMRREFQEETGVEYQIWRPLVRLYRPMVYEVYFFSAASGLAWMCDTKTDEAIRRHACDQLPENVIPNLRWLIPLALDPCVGRNGFIEIQDVAGN